MCRKKLTKNFIITIIELFFWQPHANFQLWSQSLFFLQDFFGFSKNGQKKCPKMKSQNTFGKKLLKI
jgi:hypothetical protein